MKIVEKNNCNLLKIFLTVLLIGNLYSCVSSQHQIRKVEKDQFESGQGKTSITKYHDRFSSKNDFIHKEISEMTAEDFEASGDLYIRNKNYYMAFLQYDRSLNLRRDNSRVHFKQGMLLLFTSKQKEAVKSFQLVIEKEPEHARAYEGIGMAFFELKKYEEAEKNFLKAVEIDHNLWKARNILGNIYDLQKEYEKAQKEYAKAIFLKPDEGMLYNNLGVSLSLAGKYEKAIRSFKRSLGTKGPKNRVYNNLGMTLAKMGRYDAAFEAFKKGSNSAQAYNNLGCVYMSQGDRRRAAESFKKAIETSPKFYVKANENLKKVEVGSLH